MSANEPPQLGVHRIVRWLHCVWERFVREPAYLFDEESYHHVFGTEKWTGCFFCGSKDCHNECMDEKE